MLYNVHIYTVVRIKVTNVKAESQTEAIEKAQKHAARSGAYDLFDRHNPVHGVAHTEWAEDDAYFMVDEVGDEEHEKTNQYVSSSKGYRPMRDGERMWSDIPEEKIRKMVKAYRRWQEMLASGIRDVVEKYSGPDLNDKLGKAVVDAQNAQGGFYAIIREIADMYPEEK